MKEELFQELLESVREGGAILRGEIAPARAFTVPDPNVAEVREAYGLSQAKFADLLGISVRTLQNWEQHRRTPDGPARVLLRVAARHPEAVLDVVHEYEASDRPKLFASVARKPSRKPKKNARSMRKGRSLITTGSSKKTSRVASKRSGEKSVK